MNRLQKKCVIAATGMHLLLALVIVVGPAFLPSEKTEEVQLLDFVPVATVDALVSGGGNPKANPLPPAPPAPQPPPQPAAPKTEPEIVKADPPKADKPDKPAPDAVDPKPERPKPRINTTLVTRGGTRTSPAPRAANTRSADAGREAARDVGRAIAGLRNNLSPTTSVELRGPGSGGLPYANFMQALLSAYDRAWISPEGVEAGESVVSVKVVVESNGTISSARITRPSGDPQVDRSVQQALDRVTHIPMPEGAGRRDVEFDFKTRARKAI